MKQIIHSQNHYLITVKGNQAKLQQQIIDRFEQVTSTDVDIQYERTRDRWTQRTVTVLDDVTGFDHEWLGLQRLIRIERNGTRAQQPFCETHFYITSLPLKAPELAGRIRQHWHIENRLHWPKDVILKEDTAPLCDGHAPTNLAILRTMAMNLFRLNGWDSITNGIRQLAHDIPKLFSFFQ